jgi:hypothetical protein
VHCQANHDNFAPKSDLGYSISSLFDRTKRDLSFSGLLFQGSIRELAFKQLNLRESNYAMRPSS